MKEDKKVHFHEAHEHSSTPTSPAASPSGSDTESSHSYRTPIGRQNSSHAGQDNLSNNASDKRVRSHSIGSDSTYVGQVLTVSPADELVFQSRGSGDPFDVITLANSLPNPVAFKIKTTSPEKFRVRPSSGLIKPHKTEEIHVYLVSEPTESVNRDKFLILAVDTKGESGDTSHLLKDAPRENIMQHKLRCSTDRHNNLHGKNRSSLNATSSEETQLLVKKVDQIHEQTHHIQRQLNLLLLIQFLTVSFLLLIMLSYSCLGEDLFSRYLTLPFDVCHVSQGHICS